METVTDDPQGPGPGVGERRVLVIRLRHLVMAGLVFLATFAVTQIQFANVNSDARDVQESGSKSRDYILELANWSTDRVIFDGCQAIVRQSEGNRAWKTWLLDKLDEIVPPDDDVGNDFITEGRAKLDELVPVAEASTCKNPGPPPTPPPDFIPEAAPPPSDLNITIPTTLTGAP